ncbi:hypothetical protein K438DRAFT_1779749 [Mycena galopus ATCC 62051]|nr:hypothetical protein K438DRAFT_1779749 [Mycena galopus ATCC 62051]
MASSAKATTGRDPGAEEQFLHPQMRRRERTKIIYCKDSEMKLPEEASEYSYCEIQDFTLQQASQKLRRGKAGSLPEEGVKGTATDDSLLVLTRYSLSRVNETDRSMRQLFTPAAGDSWQSDLSSTVNGMYKTLSEPNLAQQSLWKWSSGDGKVIVLALFGPDLGNTAQRDNMIYSVCPLTALRKILDYGRIL